MSYCLNPVCPQPKNIDDDKFCQTCGRKLLLKERYRAIKPIGKGGFGKTFLAVDCDKPSKPPCVIKQFSPDLQNTNNIKKAKELFEKEAEKLEALGNHSQIPRLLAHFEQDKQLYLIQEYIDGENLADEFAENGVWNETEIRALLNGILPVLKFVHDNNVIHRDIKPENIIRRRGDKTFVLVDFGAARYVTTTALLKKVKTGTIIGDPRYVAREQLKGKAIFASDLYSLGLTCLHLLTNVEPWDLFDDHEGKSIWGNYLTNSISNDLEQILNKMVQEFTKKRFQSADEILSILQPFQTQINPQLNLSQPSKNANIELTPIKLGDIWGYINPIGQVVIEPQFKEANSFINGLAKVKVNRKYGYIDQYGTRIVEPKFDEIGDFSEGLAKVKFVRKYGYVDQSGSIVIEPKFHSAEDFIDGLAKVMVLIIDPLYQNRDIFLPSIKYGYIDKYGNEIIELSLDSVEDFIDGLAKFKIDGKYGFYNKKGEMVIKPWFDEIGHFSDDLAIICVNGKYGYIDKYGNIIVRPNFEAVSDFYNGLAAVKLNEKWGYINKSGTTVIKPQFDQIYIFNDNCNLYLIQKRTKYGLILMDYNGVTVIEPQFDKIDIFNDNCNLYLIQKEGKYGLMDYNGVTVIEPQFDKIDIFNGNCNLYLIQKKGKYGLIDKTGNILVEPSFDDISYFSEGLAIVKTFTIKKVIDKVKIILPL